MEYKKFIDQYVIRLDANDKIVESLQRVANNENITLATIEGIGSVKSFTVGFFNPDTKMYQEQRFEGFYEIASLLGNITTKDNKPIIHLHAMFGDDKYKIIGGHLKEATISLTGEIFVKSINGKVDKALSDSGINIINFINN